MVHISEQMQIIMSKNDVNLFISNPGRFSDKIHYIITHLIMIDLI